MTLAAKFTSLADFLKQSLRSRRSLLIALVLSGVIHVGATVGTPDWLIGWQRPPVAIFSAVLTPTAIPALIVATKSVKPPRNRAAPSYARRRASQPLPTPKSAATFAAPENALAVERGVAADAAESGAAGRSTAVRTANDSTSLADPSAATADKPPVPTEKTTLPKASVAVAAAAAVTALPSRASIAYKATTSVADGVAHYTWKRDGDKYSFESTIAASGFFVHMFAGTITQQSTGSVTSAGLEPALFTIRRGDREAETAEFQRETKEIRLSRGLESRQIPMPADLQDTQSFLFQLAIEAARLKTSDDRVTILVTNARSVNRYVFKKVGESTLETRLGPVETVHLVRETNEPRDSYEAWLSPKYHYLPVKLKFFVDRFPAELIATSITSAP